MQIGQLLSIDIKQFTLLVVPNRFPLLPWKRVWFELLGCSLFSVNSEIGPGKSGRPEQWLLTGKAWVVGATRTPGPCVAKMATAGGAWLSAPVLLTHCFDFFFCFLNAREVSVEKGRACSLDPLCLFSSNGASGGYTTCPDN